MLRSALDWVFRNRETGKITIAQLPNAPMAIFIAAVVIRRAFEPAGTVGTVVDVIAGVAIVWWSVDEIVRGVNPWRRALGSVVLALTLYGLVAG